MKTDAAGKYTRPAAGPGISSGTYGGAGQLPAVQTIPFQPLQIQQEPMQKKGGGQTKKTENSGETDIRKRTIVLG